MERIVLLVALLALPELALAEESLSVRSMGFNIALYFLVLFGLSIFIKRMKLSRSGNINQPDLKIVSSVSISARAKVVVLEWEGSQSLIAVADNQVCLIQSKSIDNGKNVEQLPQKKPVKLRALGNISKNFMTTAEEVTKGE